MYVTVTVTVTVLTHRYLINILELVTLGNATQIGSFLASVVLPREADSMPLTSH